MPGAALRQAQAHCTTPCLRIRAQRMLTACRRACQGLGVNGDVCRVNVEVGAGVGGGGLGFCAVGESCSYAVATLTHWDCLQLLAWMVLKPTPDNPFSKLPYLQS
jgi:hypothetical protein